jgi:hypothetical protein
MMLGDDRPQAHATDFGVISISATIACTYRRWSGSDRARSSAPLPRSPDLASKALRKCLANDSADTPIHWFSA